MTLNALLGAVQQPPTVWLSKVGPWVISASAPTIFILRIWHMREER